jgi:cytochrome c peroxidase
MGRYELGQHISVDETLSLVAFLRALTGDIPADYIKKPAIPSTPSHAK